MLRLLDRLTEIERQLTIQILRRRRFPLDAIDRPRHRIIAELREHCHARIVRVLLRADTSLALELEQPYGTLRRGIGRMIMCYERLHVIILSRLPSGANQRMNHAQRKKSKPRTGKT